MISIMVLCQPDNHMQSCCSSQGMWNAACGAIVIGRPHLTARQTHLLCSKTGHCRHNKAWGLLDLHASLAIDTKWTTFCNTIQRDTQMQTRDMHNGIVIFNLADEMPLICLIGIHLTMHRNRAVSVEYVPGDKWQYEMLSIIYASVYHNLRGW